MKRLKILLVDDDPDILDVLGLFFEMDGAEVAYAKNYNEAIEQVEKSLITLPFDIVITDFRMPRMHGLYLLDMIKDISPDMPVIIMTAYKSEEMQQEAIRKKVDFIIQKPFTYDVLLEKIIKLMREKWRKQNGTEIK